MHAESTHAGHDHTHGPNCGHSAERHGDHVDYLHDGHHHRQHGQHWDECSIEDRLEPMAGSEQVAMSDEQAGPRGRDEMAEELRTSTGP